MAKKGNLDNLLCTSTMISYCIPTTTTSSSTRILVAQLMRRYTKHRGRLGFGNGDYESLAVLHPSKSSLVAAPRLSLLRLLSRAFDALSAGLATMKLRVTVAASLFLASVMPAMVSPAHHFPHPLAQQTLNPEPADHSHMAAPLAFSSSVLPIYEARASNTPRCSLRRDVTSLRSLSISPKARNAKRGGQGARSGRVVVAMASTPPPVQVSSFLSLFRSFLPLLSTYPVSV